MKRNNLLGRKFSRLTVIAEAEPRVYESRRKSDGNASVVEYRYDF